MDDIKEPLIICFLIVFALAFVFLAIPVLKKSSTVTKEAMGENEFGENEEITATILSKKRYTPNYSMERLNFIVFELETGERIELVIKNDEEYKLMFEGDKGLLTHIGKKYISFKRYH